MAATRQFPTLTVIKNSEEDALRAYFRRLYMIEKYLLEIMLDNNVQVHCKLLHSDAPRQYQGRIRFNGGIALGFNPYSGLPSAFFTPLGALDLSKGFPVYEETADTILKILNHDLGLRALEPIPSIVPGVQQQVYALSRDPYGNPLPKAAMIDKNRPQGQDKDLENYISDRESAFRLWERVRLREEPSPQEQIILSIPRKTAHIQAVA